MSVVRPPIGVDRYVPCARALAATRNIARAKTRRNAFDCARDIPPWDTRFSRRRTKRLRPARIDLAACVESGRARRGVDRLHAVLEAPSFDVAHAVGGPCAIGARRGVFAREADLDAELLAHALCSDHAIERDTVRDELERAAGHGCLAGAILPRPVA